MEPDLITYRAAIRDAKGYLWRVALELLAEMQAQKFEPEVIAYSAALRKRMRERILVA